MKILFKTLLTVSILTSVYNPLYAHGGHKHKQEAVNIIKVIDIADSEVNRLARSNKVAKSWLKASVIDAKKKVFGSKSEWVVRYKNINIKSVRMQTLYVFVGMDGKVNGANYTGN
ncbi:DUF6488 family protein [Sulfurimonas sp.]